MTYRDPRSHAPGRYSVHTHCQAACNASASNLRRQPTYRYGVDCRRLRCPRDAHEYNLPDVWLFHRSPRGSQKPHGPHRSYHPHSQKPTVTGTAAFSSRLVYFTRRATYSSAIIAIVRVLERSGQSRSVVLIFQRLIACKIAFRYRL